MTKKHRKREKSEPGRFFEAQFNNFFFVEREKKEKERGPEKDSR